MLVGVILAFPGAGAAEELKIVSFNIQIFGRTKVNKPDIRAYLAVIVRHFDIVAIQEIKDATQETPGKFLDAVNATGYWAANPRCGASLDRLRHRRYQCQPNSACAYDRMVANRALFSHFKLWSIANWFTDRAISDHWPVWVNTAHP